MSWQKFRQELIDRFNLEELRLLCFDLGIDYESLRGENKPAKVQELLALARRTDRLDQLVDTLQAQRPSVDWQNLLLQALADEKIIEPQLLPTPRVWWSIAVLTLIILVGVVLFLLLRENQTPSEGNAATVAALEAEDCFQAYIRNQTNMVKIVPTGAHNLTLLESAQLDEEKVGVVVTDFGQTAGFILFRLGPDHSLRVEEAIDNRCRIADQYQNITTAKWQGDLASEDLMRISLSGTEYFLRLSIKESQGLVMEYLDATEP